MGDKLRRRHKKVERNYRYQYLKNDKKIGNGKKIALTFTFGGAYDEEQAETNINDESGHRRRRNSFCFVGKSSNLSG